MLEEISHNVNVKGEMMYFVSLQVKVRILI